MPTWSLADADALAAENPYTFFKPSSETIRKVVAGEVVKLIFYFQSDTPNAPSAERMWVLVDEILPNGRFSGRLANHPKYIADLKHGDRVDFDERHIIDTEHAEPGNLVSRLSQRCFVTNRVLKDGARIGYLYREPPDADDDSGWRFTANDESTEYMEDERNSAYVSLGAVLSKDDSVLSLLSSPEGSAFVRGANGDEFVAVD